jgi:hypothetical protein
MTVRATAAIGTRPSTDSRGEDMSTIRIALLTAGLLAAAGSVQAQSPSTTPSTTGSPTMTAPDANKAERPQGSATQGVEGSTGTQGGPDPAAAKNSSGPMPHGRAMPQSATDPATGRDVDKSTATQGVPAAKGAQGGPDPVQPGQPKAGTTKQ